MDPNEEISGGVWAGEIRWGRLTWGRIQDLLRNPSYAGAYVYGRFRSERWIDAEGVIRTRTIAVSRAQWEVLIRDHHPAYISWQTYLRIQKRWQPIKRTAWRGLRARTPPCSRA